MENSKYEWLDNEVKVNPQVKENSNYKEPERKYDNDLVADKQYIATLPDLQNGPSSLIQGSHVAINQVGIHNFKLPLNWVTKDGIPILLETSVTGTVSLEAQKKGINMSRIIRSFYEHKDQNFDIDYVQEILELYKKNLGSFDARILLHFSYPIMQRSLRSNMQGYQYYQITTETVLNRLGTFEKYIHFDFVYSSACPCSYELAEHARMNRNRATVSHSQRSTTRVSIKYQNHIWFEDLRDMCLSALKTETQVMVKREDEQAFAELNGSYLKFVEDATRLMHEQLNKNEDVLDFKIICSHLESLHSHDAIGVLVKGIEGGFTPEVSYHELRSLVK